MSILIHNLMSLFLFVLLFYGWKISRENKMKNKFSYLKTLWTMFVIFGFWFFSFTISMFWFFNLFIHWLLKYHMVVYNCFDWNSYYIFCCDINFSYSFWYYKHLIYFLCDLLGYILCDYLLWYLYHLIA